MEQAKRKVERKNRRSIPTFLVFLAISTAAWFMVKLSEDYTTQTSFRLQFVDVPADKWISSPEQTVKLSMTVDGFHTLRYKILREAKHVVILSLAEVPYHLESGTTYSFGSQYVAERVAQLLSINASDITINEAKVYFNMESLRSKVVPVVLRSDIRMQRQFGMYGIPVLEPASVTVYGPEEIIDTLKSVKTALLSRANVSESFRETVALDLLDGRIHCNETTAQALVQVEKFTETDIKVPILPPKGFKMRFFPDAMTVKCLVAIKDYAALASENFSVAIDTAQLHRMQPLLDVRLATWPPNVQVLASSPDKVEYLIVQ